MNKMLVKVPTDILERIFLSVALAEHISGKPAGNQEIMSLLKKNNVELTKKR